MTAAGDGTVLALLPRALLGWLGQSGHDAEGIAAEVGLEAMGWDDPDERVPRAKVDALWNAAVRETKDGALGLRIWRALPPHNTGVLQVVAHSAPSVEIAMRHVCRYWGLINDAVETTAQVRGDRYVIAQRTKNGVPLARAWVDLTAIGLVESALKSLTQPLGPLEVVFPYARDSFSAVIERELDAPVRYGGAELEIHMPAEVAKAKLHTSNPALHAVVAAHAESALSRLLRERAKAPAADDTAALIAEVRAAVLARLEAGDTQLPEVADAVGLAPRTLQRRLADAGTSLREVVDAARREQALEELARDDVSITEVAFLLGFSETSAFDRAFRRWTGKSPAEFRGAARSVN